MNNSHVLTVACFIRSLLGRLNALLVAVVGLEPTRAQCPADFKSASVTNYDTPPIIQRTNTCTQLRIYSSWEMRDSNPRPAGCKPDALYRLRQSPKFREDALPSVGVIISNVHLLCLISNAILYRHIFYYNMDLDVLTNFFFQIKISDGKLDIHILSVLLSSYFYFYLVFLILLVNFQFYRLFYLCLYGQLLLHH